VKKQRDQPIFQPDLIRRYNFGMDGVDVMDRLLTSLVIGRHCETGSGGGHYF